MNVFEKTKQQILREVRADRDAALEAYKSAGSIAVDTLVEIMVSDSTSATQKLAAISEWNSILTHITRLNTSAAARDSALAAVRKQAVDLVRVRAQEKRLTHVLILEDKRLARAKKRKEKEMLELGYNVEAMKKDGLVS